VIDRKQVAKYLDVERYGLGVPFGSFSLALGLSVFTAPGVTQYHSLTVYGKIGVAFLVLNVAAMFMIAGYTFRFVDIDDYVRRKEDIREEHESEQSDSNEDTNE
jgi:hypothetical protein